MINIGKLGFDLGINMAGFTQNLAQAGASIAGFAAKNTSSFAGARAQFAQYNQTLGQNKAQLVQQNQAIQALIATHARQTGVLSAHQRQLDAQNKTLADTRVQVTAARQSFDALYKPMAAAYTQIQGVTAALAKQRQEVIRLEAAHKAGTATRSEVDAAKTIRSKLIGSEQYLRRTIQMGAQAASSLRDLDTAEAQQARQARITTNAMDAQNVALRQTDKELHSAREAFADTAEAVGKLEQQARKQPGAWRRNLDAMHAFTSTAERQFNSVKEGAENFSRGLERMTRGIRGVPVDVRRANDEFYRLQQRLRTQAETIKRADLDYERFGKTIIATQSALAASQARLAERRQKIVAVEANLQHQIYRLQVMEFKGAPQTAITKQRENIELVRHQIVKWGQEVKTTEGYLDRQRTTLEKLNVQQAEAKRYTESAREAYTNLESRLKETGKRIKELVTRHRENAAAQKEAKKGTDEEGFSLDRLIAKIFGWVRGNRQASESLLAFNGRMRETNAETGRLTSALGRMGSFIHNTLVVGLGSTIGNVFGSLINQMRGVSTAGAGQVKSYEQLSFSINALMAREERLTDSHATFAEAMAKTRGRTKDFTDQIEQLGITSTYTSNELAGVFQNLLTSFGSDTALHITKTITAWGDATSKTAFDLEGVGTALNQIQQKGKVQLEEINQLRERNVNAVDYLAKAYHKTTEEILNMISAGDILSSDAIPAIINGMRGEFRGAGEQAAQTFQGLTSSIIDLSQRALRQVFTPILERLRPLLSQVINYLSNPQIIQSLGDFGETVGTKIAQALEWIGDILPNLIESISSFADALTDGFATVIGFAEEAYIWGGDIVDSFLNGMMSRVGSISDVASWIGSELSYWMEPHSPPRIAPDIDKWGTRTAQGYFDAMANADGGRALTDLGAQVAGAAPAAVATGGAATAAGGAPLDGLSATNNILTYIAGMFERFLTAWEQMRNPSGGRSGGRSGAAGEDVPPGDRTAEYYRQINEQRLGGGRGGAGGTSQAARDEKGLFDAKIKNLTATGDFAGALDLLHERQTTYNEDSKEYLDIGTKIAMLEKQRERAEHPAAKARGTTLKANLAIQKQDFYAQVNFLTKTGETSKAIALLESRQAKLRKTSKEYLDIELRLIKLRKGDTSDATGIPFEGLEPRKPPPPGDAADRHPATQSQQTYFQQMLARLRAQATAFRATLAPFTAWIREHQAQIGFVLTTIGIRLARAFIVARVLPILRDFAHFLGLAGATAFKMLTPLNLLKIAINLFAVAWIRDWGGIREIFARMLSDVIPHLVNLRRIAGEIFGPSNAGLSAKIRAFVARLPELRAEFKAAFDRLGEAFVEWLGPLSGKIRFQMEELINSFIVWLRGEGGGMMIDAIDNFFADIGRWLEGRDTNTFIVGVVAKFTAAFASITSVLIAGLVATIGAFIIAYGPEIAERFNVWSTRAAAWIDEAIPTLLIGLAHFTSALVLGIASAGLELLRIVGTLTLKLTGWILPAIPKAISLLVDFVAAIGLWFINVGSYQFAGTLGTFVVTALSQLETTLPRFGLALGRAVGRLITSVLALAGSVVYNLPYWSNLLGTFFVNTLLPALGSAIAGFAKGLVALVGGVLVGMLDPIAETIRAGQWARGVLDWVKGFGVDFVNTFIDGLGLEVPEILNYLAGSFEQIISQFKGLLGIANRTDRMRIAVVGFRRDLAGVPPELRGFNQVVKDSIPLMGGLALAGLGVALQMKGILKPGSSIISWLGRMRGPGQGLIGVLKNGVTAFLDFGKTIVTQTIPAIARFVSALVTDALASMRRFVVYVTVQTIAALRALGMAILTLATKNIQGQLAAMIAVAIYQLGLFVTAVRTQTIPALLDFAKTAIAGAAKAMWAFIVMIWQQGIPGLVALAQTGIAAAVTGLSGLVKGLIAAAGGMKTFMISAGVIGLAILAVGIAIQKAIDLWQSFTNETKKLLSSRNWWNESTEAMQDYADASEAVRSATLDQAEAVNGLRGEIEGELEDLGRRMSAGLVSEAQYKSEMDAINAKTIRLQTATKVLKDALFYESKQNALLAASTDAYGKLKPKIATTGDELNQLVSDINAVTVELGDNLTETSGAENTFLKERTATWDEHQKTLGGMQREFYQAGTAEEKAAIQTRIDEEKKGYAEREREAAIAYVKERAEQRRHLGEMLIDYIRSQEALAKDDPNDPGNTKRTARIAAFIDQVSASYGVAQAVSEKTAIVMRGNIDKIVDGTAGDTDKLLKNLDVAAERMRRTEALKDQLRTDITTKIILDYQAGGKNDPEELKRRLDKVPDLVEVQIKAKLDDQTGFLKDDAATTLKTKASDVGKQIGESFKAGLVLGLRNFQGPLKAATDLADGVGAGMRKGFQIKSPSAVSHKIGDQVGEGLELGVRARLARLGNLGSSVLTHLGTAARGAAAVGRASVGTLSPAGAGGNTIHVPVTITGNTVRSEDDLKRLEQTIMTKVVRAIDTIVLQGMK
jgi:tape measure domain-containing protein